MNRTAFQMFPSTRIKFRSVVFFFMLGCITQLLGRISLSAQETAIRANEGIATIDWSQTRDYVGQTAIVTGKITDIGATKDGDIHFINFSRDRDAFKLVIFKDRLSYFPQDLKAAYLNKLVTVHGIISRFKDNPQMVLSTADQISVVDRLPKAFIPQRPEVHRVGDEIAVATLNLLNLFDSYDDPYTADESTPEKPREQLEKVAAVIREVNADVIAFQEVENRGYLKKFLDVFVPELGYHDIVHFEGNDTRGIDVCVASRVPIGRVISHRHLTFPAADPSQTMRFNRDILRVELLPEGGEPFELWALHLKSNSGGRETSEPIRLAECVKLQQLLAERLRQNPKANVIVCGDFNDTLDSPTLKTIMGTDLTGGPMLKSLVDPSQRNQVTYTEEPYRSMIDFLLVSPAMEKRFVPGSYTIRNGSLTETGTDHNPVHAKFYAKPNG